MPPLDITIDYLADHPELVDQLATLSWNEWQPIYKQRGQTFEDAIKNYRERTNRDCLPMTLVALHDEQLVGTVSLKFHDLDTRPHLDPWLGALLVLPDWRNRGVASRLVEQAVDKARGMNLRELFLWTHSAEKLYLKLGWQIVERTQYCGKEIVVMKTETGGKSRK